MTETEDYKIMVTGPLFNPKEREEELEILDKKLKGDGVHEWKGKDSGQLNL